jgi:hypothetical protein
MISNLAGESPPGSGQISELGRSRRFDDVFGANAVNLLPLSAASRTWPDLLLAQADREWTHSCLHHAPRLRRSICNLRSAGNHRKPDTLHLPPRAAMRIE